jgi:hypothetical protein
VTEVDKLVQKWEKSSYVYTKGETIHKTIQEHRIHKIENKYTKQENIGKKNNKNVGVVNIK